MCYRQRIEDNIKGLDYLTGTGVIEGNKKALADELFVFISAGGSGREVLINLKKTMKNQIEDSCCNILSIEHVPLF